ncbi:MAG TPA: hypothetical protein VGM84_19590 [Steroidobacteraceae bacterium]|jgi:hypothetical protein
MRNAPRISHLGLIIASAGCSLPALAAEMSLQEIKAASDDSSLRESSLAALSGVAFEAGEENKQARLRWSRPMGSSAFSVALSVPVDEKESRSSLADLDGLAKALSLAVSYTKYFTGPFPVLDGQQLICARVGIPDTCDNDTLQTKGTPADERDYYYASISGGWTPFVTVEGKAGRQKVDYFDSTTLAKSDDSEIPYSLSVGYGGLGISAVWLVKAKIQRAVKENDKVTYCQPAEADARVEDCATLAFGAPKLETSTVLSVEYRRFYKYVAISPALSHDTQSGESGIDVPIVFMKDAADQFTGGIRLGYTTKDDDLTASIFITKGLTLK